MEMIFEKSALTQKEVTGLQARLLCFCYAQIWDRFSVPTCRDFESKKSILGTAGFTLLIFLPDDLQPAYVWRLHTVALPFYPRPNWKLVQILNRKLNELCLLKHQRGLNNYPLDSLFAARKHERNQRLGNNHSSICNKNPSHPHHAT